jgi:hypothetical protein
VSWSAKYTGWRIVRIFGAGCFWAGILLFTTAWQVAVPLVVIGLGLFLLGFTRRRAIAKMGLTYAERQREAAGGLSDMQ